ncbi:hypothetical protein [Paracoccus sp. SSJ]|uniref:hypothetical protein n=1 Tax=Paracoccus sp. SSJ TaxID=3050636 RepID=UPI00254A05CE|nr:hypothetical protein [Paracoccus sp. SSJ]MDK8874244.1 hypothetical protein [Paracoccus sp. SSJ]
MILRTITASIGGRNSAMGRGGTPSAQRQTQRQRRAHGPADHRAGQDAQLAAEAPR